MPPMRQACWRIRSWAMSRVMRWAATTTRCCARRWPGWPRTIAARMRAPVPRVRGFRAGARKALARNAGLGLDRQAHQPHREGRRLVLLPRRDLHRPAVAGGPAGHRALRHLLGLHAGLPHQRHRCAAPARCASLHFLSHHRTARQHSRRNCARPSATASTAATTASWCARGTSSRGRQRIRTSACAMGSMRQGSPSLPPGRGRSSNAVSKAAPCGASATKPSSAT